MPVAFSKPVPQTVAGSPMPTDASRRLLGLALSQATSSLQVVRRQRLARRHPVRHVRQHRDRRKIGQHVERQRVDRARDHVLAERARCRACSRRAPSAHAGDRQRAAGAADVLDDDRLAERAFMCSTMMRASASAAPPAGNGTTRVIGRDGKVCACAPARPASTASATATISFLMLRLRSAATFIAP